MSLTTDLVKNFTGTLAGFLVGSEINKLIESQGEIGSYEKKISSLRSAASVYNKEFDDRHNMTAPYKMPMLATNQDILLLGFYFSYLFLTLVGLIILFKNTANIQNVVYGFIMSFFILLIITAILVRLG